MKRMHLRTIRTNGTASGKKDGRNGTTNGTNLKRRWRPGAGGMTRNGNGSRKSSGPQGAKGLTQQHNEKASRTRLTSRYTTTVEMRQAKQRRRAMNYQLVGGHVKGITTL
jgi:hypothetical protein